MKSKTGSFGLKTLQQHVRKGEVRRRNEEEKLEGEQSSMGSHSAQKKKSRSEGVLLAPPAETETAVAGRLLHRIVVKP